MEDRAAADRRDEARARVLAYRERGRSRPLFIRLLVAFLGVVLLFASVPLVILLPEAGVPALLVALRLLAVELDWASEAYAWIDWRFSLTRDWFHRQSGLTRVVVVAGLLLVAVALVWLVFHQVG